MFFKEFFSKKSKQRKKANSTLNNLNTKSIPDAQNDIENFHIHLPNNIQILAITDTHGYIPDELYKISDQDYDVCFLMGDLTQKDLDILKNILNLDKTYGIIGNHNYLNFLEENDIKNIHGKQIIVNGISFVGWGGSIMYKPSLDLGFDGFSDVSSCAFAKQLPNADVLISHDGPMIDELNTSHSGLKGITEYLTDRTAKLHIHGHFHQNTISKVGAAKSICIFRAAFIDQNGNVRKIC